ncbi:related to TMS1 protein [Ustilago trichophora]|uniref:Related to TMS1 protein n=1 Tax=Ustilago trichophora TaxID=86804 RepID=A0A5C3E836_9BASI|nr:related to TMS1 protein [Ustilago trichophora]
MSIPPSSITATYQTIQQTFAATPSHHQLPFDRAHPGQKPRLPATPPYHYQPPAPPNLNSPHFTSPPLHYTTLSTMGVALSLPFLGGGLASIASSCLAGLAFFCTSTAASAFFKSCNCQSSIATRVGFAIIFCLDALLAWLSLTGFMMHKIEEWSYNYIKMDCKDKDRCYGVLAVHRITFALSLFHFILGMLLIGVKDTRTKRAAIQNGWWGPKVIFIVVGLVLLVDFAHSWSETCLDRWEQTESDFWKFTLIGSTLGMYAATIALTGVFPQVQEANPRSGLAQSSMVAAYCTYLIASAVMNRDNAECNPITRGRGGSAKTTTVVIGAVFTFLAIAYSTSRAATQSKTLKDSLRIQALMAAVEAGAIPASALDEEDEDDDEMETRSELGLGGGDESDDERQGTRYNYSFFHFVFAIAACYTAMLLTDWRFVRLGGPSPDPSEDGAPIAYIGRSTTAMWMRVVSSWLCICIYMWSLVAPVLLPDRFGYD